MFEGAAPSSSSKPAEKPASKSVARPGGVQLRSIMLPPTHGFGQSVFFQLGTCVADGEGLPSGRVESIEAFDGGLVRISLSLSDGGPIKRIVIFGARWGEEL